MTFGSLFTGIGGLDLGLERAGMRCLWQVERNPYCLQVLARHWPDVRRAADVVKFARRGFDCEPLDEETREMKCPRCSTDDYAVQFGDCDCVGTDEILDTDEWGLPDLLVGGDACQSHSNAGRAADAREASLGGEFIRIVDELRPRLVLRENPAAVRRDAAWPWQRFRAALEACGYAVLPFRLRACCVGADHRRDRLFLLASLPDANSEGLERHVREEVARTDEGRHNADATGPARGHAAPRVCGKHHGIRHRMERLRGLGNAVDVGVAEWIGRQIIAGIHT